MEEHVSISRPQRKQNNWPALIFLSVESLLWLRITWVFCEIFWRLDHPGPRNEASATEFGTALIGLIFLAPIYLLWTPWLVIRLCRKIPN